MNGIDWRTIGEPTFQRIVDTLLSLEFGARGRPVDGRGGEGEIPGDFSVDDGKMIFEYKYFRDGFPARGNQRKQIKQSFKKQSTRHPEDWILIFPSKLTPFEQKYLNNLGDGTEITIGYRDRVWLDTQLSLQPNVANYFRFQSDNDYLAEKASEYRNNPLIRTAHDLADRVQLDLAMAADTDPDWGWEISTDSGSILQTLVAKHSNAQLLSPVKLSFHGTFAAGSETARDLQQADAFGYCKPITIPGHLIRDFRVTGPPIVAWEGELDHLKIGPVSPGDWFDIDLQLSGAGEVLGMFPGKARGIGRGKQGWSFEVAIGSLLSLTFRAPYSSGGSGIADFTIEDPTGARPAEVADAADFICQLSHADELHIRNEHGAVAAMNVSGRFPAGARDYYDVREIARDLVKIEQETHHRFRYPAAIDVEDRVMIRNLGLMLEGHSVAHPTWNLFTVNLGGITPEGHNPERKLDKFLEQLLAPGPHWIHYVTEEASITVLDQPIKLAQLQLGGLFLVDDADQARIREALDTGTVRNQELRLHGRPGDRVRMLLLDRFGADKAIEITPWGLNGINQKGLTFDGRPVLSASTHPSRP